MHLVRMGELLSLLSDLHTRIHNAATIALAGIGEDPSGVPVALALAFALGMVHALMPGHGKTVDGRYHFLPQNFRYEDESSIVKRGIDQERFQAWFAKIPARKSILSMTPVRVAR